MKKRFIQLDLMIWEDAREIKRNKGLFETRAKLFDPCQDL